jgi:hypothetical protein
MTDTDRTLLVLAMSCIVLTYAACVLVIEGYRELRTAIRRWRVRRRLAAVGRPPQVERTRLPSVMMRIGLEHRDGSK